MTSHGRFLDSTKELLAAILGRLVEDCAFGIDDASVFAKSNKLINAFCLCGLGEQGGLEALRGSQLAKRGQARETLELIGDAFAGQRVPYAVIKGRSFERAIYGNLPARDMGDIDLLVKEEDAIGAHRVLLAMGYGQQLGPSSGSLNAVSKASFVARISQQRRSSSDSPVKRFPFKDSYCPYVKEGWPTVELHDGFRGLPKWYTNEVVERARGNEGALVQDTADVLILLLANTYENAESFYSNYFDGKLVLRDFVDLACFILLRGSEVDQEAVRLTIDSLGIAGEAGTVLNDLDELLPGVFEGFLGEVPRRRSLWSLCVAERLLRPDDGKRATLGVVRASMRRFATGTAIGVRPAEESGLRQRCRLTASPAFELAETEDGVDLVIAFPVEFLDGVAVAVCFFGITGDSPPLCTRVIAKFDCNVPSAYLQPFDRLPDGILVWKEAGLRLRAEKVGSELRLRIPKEEACGLLRGGKVAVTSCVYDKHYDGVYWTRCRGKHTLTGGVPIGFMSLFVSTPVQVVHVDFPFGRYVISSESTTLALKLLDLFEGSALGMPVDCDCGAIRSAVIALGQGGGYDVSLLGSLAASSVDDAYALGLVIQDISDWYVREASKGVLVAHAASNLADDGVVLLMGSSGSGKTTLSLALADVWPIRGDECACIDVRAAETWTEPLPVNLKAGNEVAKAFVKGDEGVACLASGGRSVSYYGRSSFKSDSDPRRRRRIAAIIFPSYDEGLQGVQISGMGEGDFAEEVLQSLVGAEEPCVSFGRFVRMVAWGNVKLIRIRYSSAELAATYLVDYLRDGGLVDGL